MSLSLQWPVMTDSRQGETDAPSPLIPLSPSGFYTQCFVDRPRSVWRHKSNYTTLPFSSSCGKRKDHQLWHLHLHQSTLGRVVSRSGGSDTNTLRITSWYVASKEALTLTIPNTAQLSGDLWNKTAFLHESLWRKNLQCTLRRCHWSFRIR